MRNKKTLTYFEVIKVLREFCVDYELIIKNKSLENRVFRFASIKNIINNGIYYITKPYHNKTKLISESIIIVDYIPDGNIDNNIYIKVDNPQLIHYKISSIIEDKKRKGIHNTAIVSPKANIHEDAYIGPYCVIDECTIESGVQLIAHVTINDNVLIKKNTIIEPNSYIGARGMAWIWNADGKRIIQPQLGGVIIGENCILGSDISVVRGSLSEYTYIGNGTIIAHGTKIGHGSYIEDLVHMANNVSLAGNTRIGQKSFLGSASVISSNIQIAEGSIIGAGSVVNKNVAKPYSTVVGVPGKVIKTQNYNEKPNGAPKPFKK